VDGGFFGRGPLALYPDVIHFISVKVRVCPLKNSVGGAVSATGRSSGESIAIVLEPAFDCRSTSIVFTLASPAG